MGVRYGVLIGLLLAGPSAIHLHVIFPLPGNVAMIWAISGIASLAIAGAIFAAIYKPEAAA